MSQRYCSALCNHFCAHIRSCATWACFPWKKSWNQALQDEAAALLMKIEMRRSCCLPNFPKHETRTPTAGEKLPATYRRYRIAFSQLMGKLKAKEALGRVISKLDVFLLVIISEAVGRTGANKHQRRMVDPAPVQCPCPKCCLSTNPVAVRDRSPSAWWWRTVGLTRLVAAAHVARIQARSPETDAPTGALLHAMQTTSSQRPAVRPTGKAFIPPIATVPVTETTSRPCTKR